MKKGKKYKVSQHDESFTGGATSYDDKETQDIVDSKIKERIRFQRDIRATYIACMSSQVNLNRLVDIYTDYDKKENQGKFIKFDGTEIQGTWKLKKNDRGELEYGYIETPDGEQVKVKEIKKTIELFPVDVNITRPKDGYGLALTKQQLRWEIEARQHNLAELISKLNYSVAEITKLGFNEKQIDAIKYDGKYITNPVKLNKMEEDWLEANNYGVAGEKVEIDN